MTPHPKPRRIRDEAHLAFVRTLPCIACAVEGRESVPGSVDAAHVSYLGVKGFGSKVDDRYAVSLCRSHHDEQHRLGNERLWWARLGVNPDYLCGHLMIARAYSDVQKALEAGTSAIYRLASGARRLPRLVTGGELAVAIPTGPTPCTVRAHMTDRRDANGNVEVIVSQHGATDARAWVAPDMVEQER